MWALPDRWPVDPLPLAFTPRVCRHVVCRKCGRQWAEHATHYNTVQLWRCRDNTCAGRCDPIWSAIRGKR